MDSLSTDDFNTKLQDFNKLTENEIIALTNGTKYLSKEENTNLMNELKNSLRKILDDIIKTGEITPYEWKNIRNFIIIKTKDILLAMQAAFPDCKSIPGESFDDQMEVILQFLAGFEEK